MRRESGRRIGEVVRDPPGVENVPERWRMPLTVLVALSSCWAGGGCEARTGNSGGSRNLANPRSGSGTRLAVGHLSTPATAIGPPRPSWSNVGKAPEGASFEKPDGEGRPVQLLGRRHDAAEV